MTKRNRDRDEKIVKDVTFGRTYESVGDEHGITRERVKQIFFWAAREAGVQRVFQRKIGDQENGVDIMRREMRKLYETVQKETEGV